MATEVILPKVDMDMASGTIAAWHFEAGDTVSEGDALYDIETDKAGMEVESPASGVLAHIIAQPGDEIEVGATVAWIYAEDEEIPDEPPGGAPAGKTDDDAPDAKADADNDAKAEDADEPADEPATAGYGTDAAIDEAADTADDDTDNDKVRATPAARAAARKRGVDLAGVAGSGPKGRVHADDLAAATPSAEAGSVPAGDWQPQSGGLKISRRGGRADSAAPIVLIHGFTADSMNWAPLEQVMAGRREVIRIDLPSHGASPRKTVARFEDLVAPVIEAFDLLDLGRGAHVVGHSLGGAVAAALAARRPAAVASLMLIAPAGLGPEINGDVLDGILRATRTESLAPWLQQLAGSRDVISYDFAQAAMAARQEPELRAAQQAMAAALFADGTQTIDIRDALARVDCPVRVLWGRRDQIIPWQHVLHLPERASIQLLVEAGHIPHIEARETCAAALAELIASAENE